MKSNRNWLNFTKFLEAPQKVNDKIVGRHRPRKLLGCPKMGYTMVYPKMVDIWGVLYNMIIKLYKTA